MDLPIFAGSNPNNRIATDPRVCMYRSRYKNPFDLMSLSKVPGLKNSYL